MADENANDTFADSIGQTACHKCGKIVDCADTKPFTIVECPSCKARFSAPGKLDQFVLLKVLGKGSMGTTYKAYDRTLGRYVAIKAMHASMGRDQRRADGFLAEARALASLNHLNVAQVYSLGKEKDRPYIVMELISGGRLDRQYSKDSPLPEARALDIIIDVAEGLQAANSIGLIHGDVKPANILMDDQGTAKLVDFGIARLGGGQVSDDEALGTPHYVAPEQIRRESVDLRTDMYSLGATLYCALTATPPFKGETVKEVLRARFQVPPPDARAVRSELHPTTAALVARMMSVDPSGRYASYDELLADLHRAYQAVARKAGDEATGDQASAPAGTQVRTAVPIHIASQASAQKPPSPTRGRPKRKKEDFTALVIILLGLIATVAVVLVLIWWAKQPR